MERGPEHVPDPGPGQTGNWRRTLWRSGRQIPRGCRRAQREPETEGPERPDRAQVSLG